MPDCSSPEDLLIDGGALCLILNLKKLVTIHTPQNRDNFEQYPQRQVHLSSLMRINIVKLLENIVNQEGTLLVRVKPKTRKV